MKKVILFGALALLTSCGVSSGLIGNLNNHTTQVVLSKNNFKVVEHVTAEATNSYFLFFGGSKKASRAVINETVEEHTLTFVIGTIYTITVSADVIEFTKD